MALLSLRHIGDRDGEPIPVGGRVAAIILLMITLTVITVCLCRRLVNLPPWRSITLTRWLILIIYFDSFCFVFATALINQGLGLNTSSAVCSGAIYICLAFYMTTKILIYLFLVERVRIVRGHRKPRSKDRLYIFNFFGMLFPYIAVIILNLKFRWARLTQGVCMIGIDMIALIPLVGYDVVANVYLTLLFMLPLFHAYSFKNSLKNNNLRRTALRAFIGGCVTLASSVANLLTLLILRGEQSWICLLCCNSDILFSVMVLQWMTSGDGPTVRASYPPASPSNHAQHASRASNDSKTTCKGQELFDLGRILNRPESDLATARSRQTVVVSQISSEENELKEESNYSGGDESADGKNEKIPAMILKTMSVTVESTREGSLVEEHIEAQTIDDKEDSG